MSEHNNFTHDQVTSSRKFRLFVKYKNEFAAQYGAYAGGIKTYYPFKKKGNEDVDGLIHRISVERRTHYVFAWLFENRPDGGFGDVLRAWDEKGFELHPQDVARLNQKRKSKNDRKNKRQWQTRKISSIPGKR